MESTRPTPGAGPRTRRVARSASTALVRRPSAVVLVAALALGTPARASGQAAIASEPAAARAAAGTASAEQSLEDLTATPESAADLFLRSVRAIRWSAAAQFLDEETLARFYQTVAMIADADDSGELRDFLAGVDSLTLVGLDHAAVFDHSIGAVIDDMPGLMHAIFDRDDEVLGHVPEGPSDAHVVYRTTARISGAVSEVKVMQLRRGDRGWRVFWSDELEVLDAALRGLPRTRRPPSG